MIRFVNIVRGAGKSEHRKDKGDRTGRGWDGQSAPGIGAGGLRRCSTVAHPADRGCATVLKPKGLLLYALLVALLWALIGYEVDVVRDAGTEVYRRERFVPIWEAMPSDDRAARRRDRGWPTATGAERRIKQYFLFGLETRDHADFRIIIGPCIKPPAVVH
jgi:hypothetical protein